MRRLLLLALLCSLPLLAHADALDSVFVLLAAGVFGLAGVGVAITLWAYFRPASQLAQVVNWLFILISLGLGAAWRVVFETYHTPLFAGFNPFSSLAVPLALWLGAARRAASASLPVRRLLWVSVAALGAYLTISPLVFLLLRSVFGTMIWQQDGSNLLRWALNAGLAFGTWWLVLRQVQAHQPLGWWPVLLAPALTAGLMMGYSLGSVWFALRGPSHAQLVGGVSQLLASTLGYGALHWGGGVGASWLRQLGYSAGATPPAAGRD